MFFDYGPILLVLDILKAKQNPYKQPGRIVLCFIKHRKRIRKGPSVEHKYFSTENDILQNTNKFMKVTQSFRNPSWSPHQWHLLLINCILVLMRLQNYPINWGKAVALIMVHCRLLSMKAGGFLGQLFLKRFFFLGRCHTWTWQQKSLKYKNPIYFLLCAIKRNYVNFYFLWLRTNFVSARHFENKTNSYKQPRRIVLWFTKHRKRFRKGPSVEHKYFCNENNNILQHQQIHQSYAELLEPILIPSLVTLVVNKLHPRFDEATKLSY